MAGCVTSLAVTVEPLPAVLSVTLNVFTPPTSAALAGSTAFASDAVMLTVSLVLIWFQFASTEYTVTLNGTPADAVEGVPALPVGVPGAAVSPGIITCSFTNTDSSTVIGGLVLLVLVGSVMSLTVTVLVPSVLSVTLSVFVPDARLVLAGKTAFESLDDRPIVSEIAETTFHWLSTALTVTLKAMPEVCDVGAPVLPLAVPGAESSPGTKICSFVNGPVFTTNWAVV